MTSSSEPPNGLAGRTQADPAVPTEDLEDLYENAPCGYLSIDPTGRIHKVNATFASWSGFDAKALIGKHFHDLLNIAGRIYYETHFAPLLRMQGFFNEVALDLVDAAKQKVPVLVNAAERRDATGALVFIRMTVFNASDRRRYERELLDARMAAETASTALRDLNARLEDRIADAVEQRMKVEKALRQSQKMEALGQLTGGVAHDFNNLLTIIIGGLDAIGRQVAKMPDSAEVGRIRRSAEMSLQGAKRSATLTARLLAFSRQQTLAPRPLDINRVLADTADLLQRTLGETIQMETVSAAGLWRAFADPDELGNVLVNLAVNARDAMARGGCLTIESANTYLDDAYVAGIVEPVSPGQYVLLAVSDTGHGMDQTTLAKVFEPFFTTKEVGRGTGLGLSQVYGFIRQTGGHVRIYSEIDQGTTVKIYLPRFVGEEIAGARDDATVAPVADGGAETILIVEDNEDLRVFGAEALRDLGYEVLEAGSGPAALSILESTPRIVLLFTDIVMPGGMNGRELARAALQLAPELKVLFTTGYTRNAIVHNGILDAGVQLLAKPFTYEQLAAKVRLLLDDA